MTMSVAPEAVIRPRSRAGGTALLIVSKYGTLIAMAIMLVIFAITVPNGAFFTANNLLSIVNQSSLTAIIACGLTMVLVVGEFDLSIGYMASLAGVLVTGFIANQGLPILLAVVVTLIIGGGIGAANGILVTKARVNAVVATLGVGTILTGLAFGYTAGSPITQLPEEFTWITLARFMGVQNPIWFMLIVVAVLWLVLNRTAMGQRIQAVGANPKAARLAGIRVDRAKITAFVIAGACAALTGVLLASILGSGTVSAADGYLMDSFAAVFLGSATLRDGEFHILGTLVGVLVVSVGFNGLALLGTPTFWQYIFKGGILVLAVALSTIARRYARR
ncbi:dolichyl-phosphate beta-glucosyltransferase [Microbacterium sp. CH12i]|uniref:ABC transporter permease n=1 Tax=Microbacterium sp. CH12i TaxID=1479651 RepID=UPI0004616236|nr:ABC transporter permease [Microbacterium sp. CH12i]KDA06829.1 dolichyl-phosphate beta-glucosyltransferase [Microbacterium sp. CH12i]